MVYEISLPDNPSGRDTDSGLRIRAPRGSGQEEGPDERLMDGIQRFLDQPDREKGEEALLQLGELDAQQLSLGTDLLEAVLLRLCQQGLLDGSGLKLLPPTQIATLWQIVATQEPSSLHNFLESHRDGPFQTHVARLLTAGQTGARKKTREASERSLPDEGTQAFEGTNSHKNRKNVAATEDAGAVPIPESTETIDAPASLDQRREDSEKTEALAVVTDVEPRERSEQQKKAEADQDTKSVELLAYSIGAQSHAPAEISAGTKAPSVVSAKSSKPPDWRSELKVQRDLWQRVRSENVDLTLVRASLRAAITKACQQKDFSPDDQRRLATELQLDLKEPDQRDLISVLWNGHTQSTILNQLTRCLRQTESAEKRADLVTWVLQRGDENALLEWSERLETTEREDLLRRLRELQQLQIAGRLLREWLVRGFLQRADKLHSELEIYQKFWNLCGSEPDLPRMLAEQTGQCLFALAAQKEAEMRSVFDLANSLAEVGPVLCKVLEDGLFAQAPCPEMGPILALLLPSTPEGAVIKIGEWTQRYPQVDASVWSDTLSRTTLPNPPELELLLQHQASAPLEIYGRAYHQRLQSGREQLLTWVQATRQRLEAQRQKSWQSLCDCLTFLEQAWKGEVSLLDRLVFVRESLFQPPSLQEVCASLWQLPPDLPPSPEGGSPPITRWEYIPTRWSEWTGLTQPDQGQFQAWLSEGQSADDLADLAFGALTAVVENQADETGCQEIRGLLVQMFDRRPDVFQLMQETAGAALRMLPSGFLSASESGWTVERILELARRVENLEDRGRQAREDCQHFQQNWFRAVARRIGPALDNLESLLLPYFQYRERLGRTGGLETAVARLCQPVDDSQLGATVLPSEDEDSDEGLFTRTLGLRQVDQQVACWPAQASPRPLQ